MPTSIGKMMATLGLDNSEFKNGLNDADNAAGGFGSKVTKGANMATLAIGSLGIAAVGGLGLSINAAAGFEKQLDAVGAVAGATDDQMKGLHDTALRIGKDTAFSASEAAKAMEILAQNGLSVEQIMNGAADATVNLAAASGSDLKVAADIASTAMQVWKLSGDQLNDVVNRTAGLAVTGRFDIEDMGQAIAMGGGIAATAGFSFEEFSAAIAGIAPVSASGSDAATAFKNAIMRMMDPTKEAKKLMGDLGIAFYDSSGKMKPLKDIIGNLNAATAGMTDEQKQAALATIFLSDGMKAMLPLMEGGTEGFQGLMDVMGNTDAAEMAKKRMGNLKGAIEALKGSVEVIMILIGEKFLPILTKVALFLAGALPAAFDKIIGTVKQFGDALAWANHPAEALKTWPDWMMPVAKAVIAIKDGAISLLAAITPLAAKVQEFVAMLSGNQTAMEAAGIIIGTVLVVAFIALGVSAAGAAVSVLLAIGPFLLVAVAVGALVAGIVLLIQHWDEIVAKFPIAGEALIAVKAIWADFMVWIQAEFIPAFMALAESVRASGEAAIGWVREHWETIKAVLTAAFTAIMTQAKIQWEMMQGVITGVLKIIKGFIDIWTGILTGDWDRFWTGIKSVYSGIWDIILALTKFVFETLKNFITNALDIYKNLWQLGWDTMVNILQSAWEEVKRLVLAGVEKVKEWIKSGWDSVVTWTEEAWGKAKEKVSEGMDKILKAVQEVGEDVLNEFRLLPSRIWNALGNIDNLLWDAGIAIMKSLLGGLKAGWDEVSGWVGSLGGKIKALKGPIEDDRVLLVDEGDAIMEGLGKGLEKGFGRIIKLLEEIVDLLEKALGKAAPAAKAAGKTVGEAVTAGIEEGLKPIGELVSGKEFTNLDTIKDWLTGWGGGGDMESVNSIYDLMRKNLVGLGYDAEFVEGHIEMLASVVGKAAVMVNQGFMTMEQGSKYALEGINDVLDDHLMSLDEMLAFFRKSPEEAVAWWNDLNDFTRDEIGQSEELMNAWRIMNIEVFEDLSLKIREQAPRVGEAMWKVLSTMDDTWKAAVQGFGRDVQDDLDVWAGIMKEGIAEGRELSTAELEAMFDHFRDYITNNDEFPEASRNLAKEAMQALEDEFRRSGSVANQALIDIIDRLRNTAAAGAAAVSNVVAGAADAAASIGGGRGVGDPYGGGAGGVDNLAVGGGRGVGNPGSGGAGGVNNLAIGAGRGVGSPYGSTHLAAGGITTGTTQATIGESGQEAVIPLDKFWSELEGLTDALHSGGNSAGDGIWQIADSMEALAQIRDLLTSGGNSAADGIWQIADTLEALPEIRLSLAAIEAKMPSPVSMPPAINRGDPGAGVKVEITGPVTVHAKDPDEGMSAIDNVAYSLGAKLRAKGIS